MEDEDAGKVKINLTILDEKNFRDQPPAEKPKRRTMNKPSGRPKKKKEVVEEDEEPEVIRVKKKKKQVVIEESESEEEDAEEEVKEGDLSWVWYVVPLGLMVLKAITTQ